VTITQTTAKPPQPLPPVGSYTVGNLQVNPTIFYLIVTLQIAGQNQPVIFSRMFPVTVSIPPVQINSFTASTQMVNYPGDEVTLSWDVTAATQVQLNGQNIEGNSATVQVFEPTTCVLEALGQGGPITAALQVSISRVQINSFTANPSVVYGQNNSVPVMLAWSVQSASQLLLNNDIITGESMSVPVNEATNFTLEAMGYGGPVAAETAVSIEDVNLTVWEANNNLNVSFGANAGAYNVNMKIFYYIVGYTFPLVAEGSYQSRASGPGVIQVSQHLSSFPMFVRIQIVQVTVSGFPSGAVATVYTPPN
jgi:hypothetical protein